ncbi:Ca-activated chloride channel family protein [Litorivivens lipolytica]|uniref:Ca-activated chloride channel family protein n=1 Tax=Litorivivens lipolytica TaxID=1524264 RepID=A0A7W4W5N2_9GAMM|nr:von Willebrand factor type A domain-containing protein [Litorivivens lipolytica]MBB3047548.1 Ca-activated chloride channel family protein [Litorivivens lipolytica]
MKNVFTVTALALAIAACSVSRDEAVDNTILSQASPPQRQEVVAEEKRVLKAEREQQLLTAKQQMAPVVDMASGSYRIMPQPSYVVETRDTYSATVDNPVKRVSDDPFSTFSVDVDTASFSVVLRYLNEGRLPPVDAVRTEELINALTYEPLPGLSASQPLAMETRLMKTPWNANTRLLQVRLNAWEPEQAELPDSNYVFLIDASGSMQGEDRIGLLKRAFSVMLDRLKPSDTVALVTYASGSRTVLEPTEVKEKHRILQALQSLSAGGSTNASDGIQRAYQLARQAFIKGGNNRVILATDGDVNVGLRGEALVEMIERQRDAGIYLTVLGVGRGNYIDAQLEPLANNGDGNYYYLDSFREARRVLVSGLKGTAYTLAKDVKLQVEFNPAVVSEYRLIGYNNRQLAHADFNNDAKDAGDIGAGHTVTALYEITLADSEYRFIDERRYGDARTVDKNQNELALIKLRYKSPEGGASVRKDHVVYRRDLQHSDGVSAAVLAAGFAEKLRQSPYLADFDWAQLLAMTSTLNLQQDDHTDLKRMVESAALLQPVKLGGM